MFSKSCEYAIRAMIFVAQKSVDKNCVSIKDIAKNTDAPIHFIAKIMQDLSRKKLVCSIKGPNGGFYMNEKELKGSISNIIKAIDGESLFTDCVLGLKDCNDKSPCPIHHQYKEIKIEFIKILESNTIIDFKEKLETKKFFLKN